MSARVVRILGALLLLGYLAVLLATEMALAETPMRTNPLVNR